MQRAGGQTELQNLHLRAQKALRETLRCALDQRDERRFRTGPRLA
jgi:hypothetical protein